MIGGEHDLLGLEPELVGDFLDGVDGGAVDVGLAGFAQAAVIDLNIETLEQGFQCRGSTVHVGGLDNLGHDEPGAELHGFARPAARRAILAGEMRSTAISTLLGCLRVRGRKVKFDSNAVGFIRYRGHLRTNDRVIHADNNILADLNMAFQPQREIRDGPAAIGAGIPRDRR